MIHKIKLVLLAIPILMASCTEAQSSNSIRTSSTPTEASIRQASKPVVKNLNAQQFHDQMDSNPGIILDVRTPGETAQGSIEGASFININDRSFTRKISLMQKEQPIYVYCASGSRSRKAADILIKNGFNEVYNLSGGIRYWRSEGYSVTAPSPNAAKNVKQLSYSEFEQMLETSKPVLIDFHTQWCAPCKKMSPVVDQLIKDNENKATVLKIDVDQSKEVADKLGIKGVPVFILFENGKETWRQSGIMNLEELQAVLNKAL